jgi:radical SAM superfamily enzyme YgiQ (UPF0313 family)
MGCAGRGDTGLAGLNERKILLVQPLGYRAEAAGRDIARLASIMPPLGLAGLSAYLGRAGIDAAVLDCYAVPHAERLVREYLLHERPAFMGLSCLTSTFLDGVRIAALAKGLLPGIRTVFGGAHVSALKERVLEDFPVVDFVVAGEGEETLLELIESGGRDAASVRGLVYRAPGGEVRFTGYRPGGVDLDSLPFPAYEKLSGYPEAYSLPVFNYPRAPNTSCITSRGCPYSCSYCDRSVFRRSYRYNSAGYMYEHLRYLKGRFGVRHVSFYDDLFTFNRKRVEDFMRMLIDSPLGVSFNCAVRAEHVDEDLLGMMKEAGCWMISLGIETGDEDMLAMHRKGAGLQLLAEKIGMIKRAGIRTKGLLMMGLPGETEASVRKSMRYVFSLPVDDFNLTKFTPFPGSPIYERIRELGEFQEDWEKMDCMHFLFIPKGMEKGRMEELYLNFYKAHFMRPRVLLGYAAMLWRSPHSWRRFMRHAGDFMRFARSVERIPAPKARLKTPRA